MIDLSLKAGLVTMEERYKELMERRSRSREEAEVELANKVSNNFHMRYLERNRSRTKRNGS